MAFESLYRGCCSRCDEWFSVGTLIECDRDRADLVWRHSPECPELDHKPTRFVGSSDEEMGF